MSEIKKENWFVSAWGAVTKYFRELKSELKKVVWPTPQQVGNNTLIVGGCCGIVGICIWLFDIVANLGIDLILNIPSLFG